MKKKSHITVTDQFCGAGGSSQGVHAVAKRTKGIEVTLALNHWKLAIETHATNFPDTIHDCTDIQACDPRRYPSTDVLITSPECTNHSIAKGKKRVQAQLDMYDKGILDAAAERSRATMWDVPRFAEYHNYNAIIVENVVDARRWVMFDAWLMAMHSLGYEHQIVYLNSQHAQPTPQSRDRMYVVFNKKGNKKPDLEIRPKAWCPKCEKDIHAVQAWKKPNVRWGKYRSQYVYRCASCTTQVEPYYYAAFNAIDWSKKGKRIGDRPKPLTDSTMERIRYGLQKYGRNPMIVTTRYTSGVDCRVRNATDVLPTQPGDASHALLSQPYLLKISHTQAGDKHYVYPTTDSHMAQTTRQETMVVLPYIIRNYGGGFNPKYAATSINDTLRTITTDDHHAMAIPPFITELTRTGKARGTEQPISTVLAGGNHHGIVTTQAWDSFIGYYYGNNQASHPAEPLGSCTTKDRHFLVEYQEPNIEDCYYRMLTSTEIGRAMAFHDDYIVLGNERERVKQYGNAVTPPAMELLFERVIQSLS